MKKRMGFVSNSSSTSFVIGVEGVDTQIVDIIKGLFKHELTKVWDNDLEEYVVSTDGNSISIDVDGWMNIEDLIDLDFLEKVGCTTKWECN